MARFRIIPRWWRIYLLMKTRDFRDRLGGWIAGHSNRKQQDYIIQLSREDTLEMIKQAQQGGFGSWSPSGPAEHRLTVEAVQGGGLLIRAWPYRIVESVSRSGNFKTGLFTLTTFR